MKKKIDTPIGTLWALADWVYLHRLAFSDEEPLFENFRERPNSVIEALVLEIAAYFAGKLQKFSIPLYLQGSVFQHKAWHALSQIPYGQTCSYADQAERVGGSSPRAIASANRFNPIALLIPCHRVIYKDRTLGGYRGGADKKKELLEHERRYR